MILQKETNNIKRTVMFLIFNTLLTSILIAQEINNEKKLQYSNEIGNIVFADGKATNIDIFINNTEDYLNTNGKAIGLIAYKGNDDFAKKEKIYILGLRQGIKLEWIKSRQKRLFLALVCSPSYTGPQAAKYSAFSGGVTDGYNILSGCIAPAESMSSLTFTDEGMVFKINMEKCKEKFPAFYFSENYSTLGDPNTHNTKYENEWFIPTLNELCMIYENKEILNYSLLKLSSTHQLFSKYWSVSQYYDGTPWVVDFDNGAIDYELEDFDFPKVLVIHYLD